MSGIPIVTRPAPNAYIQNGGVDRMSEMSSILCIPLYQEASDRNEPK